MNSMKHIAMVPLQVSQQSLTSTNLELDSICGRHSVIRVRMQVTFMVGSGAEGVDAYHVVAGPLDLALFTHSFLGMGQDSAQHQGLLAAKDKLQESVTTSKVSINIANTQLSQGTNNLLAPGSYCKFWYQQCKIL